MNKDRSNKTQKSFSWVQLCWLASACMLLCAAVLSFVTDELVSISSDLGISMLFAGCINILFYCKKQKRLHGSHWLLADGMSTAMLSLFLLFNQMILTAMIPFFFGGWELFSGILKAIDSLELREEHIRGWFWFSIIGTIEIVSGIAALLKPIEEFVGMHIVVALVLLVQSINYVFKVLIYPKIAE